MPEAPRSSKRRRLNPPSIVVQRSPLPNSSAQKRSRKTILNEDDLYDDIEGALTPTSTSRPRRTARRFGENLETTPEKRAPARASARGSKTKPSDKDGVELDGTPSRGRKKLLNAPKLGETPSGSARGRKNTKKLSDLISANGHVSEDDEDELAARLSEREKESSVELWERQLLDEARKPTGSLKRKSSPSGKNKTPINSVELPDDENEGTMVESTGRRRRGRVQQVEKERPGTPTKSRKSLKKTAVAELSDEQELNIRPIQSPMHQRQQRRKANRADNIFNDDDDPMDLDPIVRHESGTNTTDINGPRAFDTVHSAKLDDDFSLLKTIVLHKLSQRRPIPLMHLESEYGKVYQLLEATVTAGESNSMILIGGRGSGKSALMSKALLELSRSQKEHFHIVRLNGFVQTDDKLALREIWRQLGREMEMDEDAVGKSYADTLAMLLALLSHPDEIAGQQVDQVAKSVIFIMDEFDLFASHSRQTLLYNLLDIAQSRKAPIAVIGLTTRIDVTEALEKRVKSRFSHRYVHLSLAKSLSQFIDIAKVALMVTPEELSIEEKAVLINPITRESGGKKKAKHAKADLLVAWNDSINALFADAAFLRLHINAAYHITKSIPSLLSSLLLPISTLDALPSPTQFLSTTARPTLLQPPDSNLHLLPSLSDLALSLLISAARLSIIHDTDTCNFPLAYAEYVSLASKARINSAAAGALASGAGTRVFGKEVARKEWERLVRYGLCVPVGAGAFGLGSVGAGGSGVGKAGEMIRVDVALEEIPLTAELGATMDKWCRQI